MHNVCLVPRSHCFLYENKMYLNYKISAFVLVAVMIKRIQCDPGDDCASLTQCMGDYGAKFQSAFNPKDAKTVRKFFDIVCIKR